VRRLKPVRQNEPRRTVIRLAIPCGKLKAINFCLRQDEVFSRRMHGGEQFLKNALAMILQKIFRQFATGR
jgi:hypothetical protein